MSNPVTDETSIVSANVAKTDESQKINLKGKNLISVKNLYNSPPTIKESDHQKKLNFVKNMMNKISGGAKP